MRVSLKLVIVAFAATSLCFAAVRMFGIQNGALSAAAVADPGIRGGQYLGPNGWKEFTGRHPIVVESTARSHDASLQARLWQVSTELTGVTYPLPVPA